MIAGTVLACSPDSEVSGESDGISADGTSQDATIEEDTYVPPKPECYDNEDCELAYLPEPCTIDTCVDASCLQHVCTQGKCKHTTLKNGQSCDDDNLCTPIDKCNSKGKCVGAVKECSESSSPCRLRVCDPSAGGCVTKSKKNGTKCDDEDACTEDDKCSGGYCKGKKLPCTGDVCTNAYCYKVDGCKKTVKVKDCDDGNKCTVDDKCGKKDGSDSQGECKSGSPMKCDDGNTCTENKCDKDLACIFQPKTAQPPAACQNGDPCTTKDYCQNGTCQGGKKKNCDDKNSCTVDSCDKFGDCEHEPLQDKLSCTDGDLCTLGDLCVQGVCAGVKKNCDDGNACTQDVCQKTGTCKSESKKGTCDDGNACTEGDFCVGNTCKSKPKICNDTVECTDDTCDPQTGGCKYSPQAYNDKPCTDANKCTENDKCISGECKGSLVVCEDGNSCTENLCNKLKGCYTQNKSNIQTCDDNDACTKSSNCNSGKCVSKEYLQCGDGNPCAISKCDAKTGKCTPPEDPCNDNTVCTNDSCDKKSGKCSYSPNEIAKDLNVICNDANSCTIFDICEVKEVFMNGKKVVTVTGKCKGKPVNCDDKNNCTSDACDPKTGACVQYCPPQYKDAMGNCVLCPVG